MQTDNKGAGKNDENKREPRRDRQQTVTETDDQSKRKKMMWNPLQLEVTLVAPGAKFDMIPFQKTITAIWALVLCFSPLNCLRRAFDRRIFFWIRKICRHNEWWRIWLGPQAKQLGHQKSSPLKRVVYQNKRREKDVAQTASGRDWLDPKVMDEHSLRFR